MFCLWMGFAFGLVWLNFDSQQVSALLENNLFITPDGWISPARKVISSNFNARPEGVSPELLVIHNISLPPGEFGGGYIEHLFCNQLDGSQHPYFTEICHLEVSAHLLIDRSGEITQFVSFLDRAWHAGVSCFQGRENCNDFSIGIELEGTDELPYTEIQYRVLAAATDLLMRQFPAINAERIVGHCDIAPGRKTDPGTAFNWSHFRSLLE